MKVIQTNTWVMSLPDDWSEKSNDQGELYFESMDGEKGLYITTWNIAPENVKPADEMVRRFAQSDTEALHKMDGYEWNVVDEKVDGDHEIAQSIVDNVAQDKSYRMVFKILAKGSIVVRATFQDYNCREYEKSKSQMEKLINSLVFQA